MKTKNIINPLLLVILIPFVTKAEQKPNILFLFSDDQCFETIGSLGFTDIETPNLDRLVKSGTTFTRAYNMGSWSGAVCLASRHMLNTGRFLWRAEEASSGMRRLQRKRWTQEPLWRRESLNRSRTDRLPYPHSRRHYRRHCLQS